MPVSYANTWMLVGEFPVPEPVLCISLYIFA